MGDVIKDPMSIPNLEESFSGTKMKFDDMQIYGLSKFKLDYARALISDLKVGDSFEFLLRSLLSTFQNLLNSFRHVLTT